MIKVIYVKDSTAYGLKSGTLTSLSTTWGTLTDTEKETLFKALDDGGATPTQLKTLGTFKIYTYTSDDSVVGVSRPTSNGTGSWTQTTADGVGTYTPTCAILACPAVTTVYPQGLLPFGGVESLTKVVLTTSLGSGNTIRVAVTTDLANYKTYSSGWKDIDADAIATSGILASSLSSIPASAWAELGTDGIGFAYALTQTDYDTPCEAQYLTLTVTLIGRWDRAEEADYRYGYIDHDGISVNVTFLADGSYKVNYPNADETREIESFQEPFGICRPSADGTGAWNYVESRGDNLL